ncbi:MAG: hypothetical protein HYZ49_11480 [Chloroflexi bacterium]|nr:hypothetical protein [Chloroflexota bacterium]
MTTERARVVQQVSGDFFTPTYRITGSLGVGASGLSGLLSDTSRTFATIENAYLSRIQEPGTIMAHFAAIRIAKVSLDFIALAKRNVTASTTRPGLTRVAHHNVLIITRAFEMRGVLEQAGKLDPESVLLDGNPRFFPIFSATASLCVQPQVQFSSEAILVNRVRVDLFCGENI